MSYTIAQLKVDLTGRLHGTSLNKVKGINDLISRAGRQLLLDCDPAETRKKMRVAATFFDSVYDHPVPEDLKGDRVIDIRPVNDRALTDNVHQTNSRQFDLYKTSDAFQYTVEHNEGAKYIRISADVQNPGILIDELDSLTATGVWTYTSQIFNLTVDTVAQFSSGGAFRFDINGAGGVAGFPLLLGLSTTGGSAALTGVLNTAIDLSTHANVGSFFVFLFVEDATKLTSITFKWGSSTSDYYTQTVTTGHAEPFHNGLNLLRFDWFGATRVGSPVNTAINSVEFDFSITGALYNVRLDSLYSRVPKYYEIMYYSKYLFRSSAGVWKETVEEETDLVNLDTESYNLLLDCCEYFALRQLKQQGVDIDVKSSQQMYEANVQQYQNLYKSQADVKRNRYYRPYRPVRRW